MSIREHIFKVDDRNSEVVSIPEWDVKIEFRAITAREQQDLLRRCRNNAGELNTDMLAVETILATAYDPESGEKVFDPADRDSLLNKSASAFARLLVAANRAGGMSSEDEVVSGLDETPAADISSD